MKKFLTLSAILSLAIVAASCSSADNTANTNANNGSTASTTKPGPDNSEITTTNENGVRTETRTFKNNPRISRIVVTTKDGKSTAKAYGPNGEERELSAPEKALNATGDAIADSAGWVKDKSVDTTKDVADKTKDATKTVADKTVEGTEKVVNKTADTAKTAGTKTKEGAKAVVNTTKEGAKKTTNAVKKVLP